VIKMDTYKLMGERHFTNTYSEYLELSGLLNALRESGKGFGLEPETVDKELKKARDSSKSLEDITEYLHDNPILKSLKINSDAISSETSDARITIYKKIVDEIKGFCDACKVYGKIFEHFEKEADYALDSQKNIIHEIVKTMPKIIYHEGTKSNDFKILDKTVGASERIAKKVIYLDEGVEGYDMYSDKYVDREKREKVWLEKMIENGPGTAVMGANHVESMKKKLEAHNLKVEVPYTISMPEIKADKIKFMDAIKSMLTAACSN
jgi:hypothetical protein